MRTLGIIGAFISGAIAGAAIGVLCAPEKGKETQKKLTEAVNAFLKKYHICLSKQEVCDLVDTIQEAASDED